MDTRCNGSTDNCTECHLTTIHCLFLIDVSLIRDCCERNTKKHDRSKNIQYKDQSACTYTNTVHSNVFPQRSTEQREQILEELHGKFLIRVASLHTTSHDQFGNSLGGGDFEV